MSKKRYTTKQFISKARNVHGDRYDYSEVRYVRSDEPVTIICPEHGPFGQEPRRHLQGRGCPSCSKPSRHTTTEQFVEKARAVHGDRYDYSLVDYSLNSVKVTIVCRKHGPFNQTPNCHVNQGQGCPRCVPGRDPSVSFESRAREVHGDSYGYDRAKRNPRSTERVTITCPVHGDFRQVVNHHLSGCGCPECGREARTRSKRISHRDFVRRAKEVHGDRYSYGKTRYLEHRSKVTITCREHGDFDQWPSDHLRGMGCPRCGAGCRISGMEDELLSAVREAGYEGKVSQSCRDLIPPMEVDLHFPEAGLAVEMDGNYWHSERFQPDRRYHLEKTEACGAAGVRLLHVFEDEWALRRGPVVTKVLHMLGARGERWYARQLEVAEVDHASKNAFMELHHVQGGSSSQVSLALLANGGIAAAMSFRRCVRRGRSHPGAEWELDRYATGELPVVGGASRLLRAFERGYSPESVVSYADRRWSDGGMYRILGFEPAGVTEPDYFYVHPEEKYLKRENKRNYQRSRLPFLLEEFDPSLSEVENMRNHGFLRIWDCGKMKFVKRY